MIADLPPCDWGTRAKPVPENPDGTPRYSILEQLSRDERSGIEQTEPGRYRSHPDLKSPYPRG